MLRVGTLNSPPRRPAVQSRTSRVTSVGVDRQQEVTAAITRPSGCCQMADIRSAKSKPMSQSSTPTECVTRRCRPESCSYQDVIWPPNCGCSFAEALSGQGASPATYLIEALAGNRAATYRRQVGPLDPTQCHRRWPTRRFARESSTWGSKRKCCAAQYVREASDTSNPSRALRGVDAGYARSPTAR